MATLEEQVQGERMARIVLSMIAEPDDPITGYILARYGGVAALGLAESDRDVTGLPRADVLLWRERLRARIAPDLLDRAVGAQQQGFDTLIPADRGWPAGMDDLGDRVPYVLWTKGASSFLTAALSDRVSITGARAASGYGEHVTRELATGLADEQRVVVAGGAYGIEGAAHRAVLAAAGQPIAVLAAGLDRRYPAGHGDLLDRVGDAGLLVSELPPGTAPTKHRFEARNRLMAALSGAVVIPEAGVRSGSFTTVRDARSLGRAVGAVPGPVTSVASAGPNELIKQGLASVVTQASDVIALLEADTVVHDVMNRSGFGRGHRIDRSGPG
ncbi:MULTISPECIES: DNA-processing protein DprA [Microbacterium]|jgi:DNA processing protein|uniref:DNA-processing protein DprA n=1 Tax=Microbacterium TaxID=33882 RepID=UPI0010F77766|nr:MULTISPECIES: DNA-processing protein DprA [unclassified Microbacterium]MBN9152398.1 DNA-protecting protein DprA [Microbacterium sp.]MCK9913868.1 DNA-protecting protein DprA [Microbacteriaceae bacterium K1510]